MTTKTTNTEPKPPAGRLTGQRFFRVGERNFYYVMDDPAPGYSGSRTEKWLAALEYAEEIGVDTIEERGNHRLNDYVGPGVFGLVMDGRNWDVGASALFASYDIRWAE